MFVFYTKRFDGTLGIKGSPKRPPANPIEGPPPLHVQEVDEQDADLPLSVLERLYPPTKGDPER